MWYRTNILKDLLRTTMHRSSACNQHTPACGHACLKGRLPLICSKSPEVCQLCPLTHLEHEHPPCPVFHSAAHCTLLLRDVWGKVYCREMSEGREKPCPNEA